MPYARSERPAVGDRVRVCVECPDYDHAWPPIGGEGVVVGLYREGNEACTVDFSENPGCPTSSGAIWWTGLDRIEPVEITPAAFYLVEGVNGEFVPVENTPTFANGKAAADHAKLLSERLGHRVQVRPIAKDVDGAWRKREETRMTDGTYPPMPEAWDLAPIADHFLHLSKDDPKKVAFTESPEKGVLDRQTKMLPGRYLERFYGHLSDMERKRYIAMVDKPEEVLFATTADEIEWVYTHGPESCMSKTKNRYNGNIHPTRAYGGGDITVAYLKNTDGRVSARAVCWQEKKIYGRCYGDESRLRQALDAQDFKDVYIRGGGGEHFDGARIAKVWSEDIKGYVGPYLDMPGYLIDEKPRSHKGFFVFKGEQLPPAHDAKAFTGKTLAQMSSQYGDVYLLRYCPKLENWQHARGFAKVEGEKEMWSEDAIMSYTVRVEGKRYPTDQCYIGECGTWRLRKDLPADRFICPRDNQAYHETDKHILHDGSLCGRRIWESYGYVCAGSGLNYLLCDTRRETIGDRNYARAWIQQQAHEARIDYYSYLDLLIMRAAEEQRQARAEERRSRAA